MIDMAVLASPIEPAVAEFYAEEAAFFWLQRAAAVRAPNYRLRQLAELDERLEAHVDGVRMAGPIARQAAQAVAVQGGPEEAFVAGVLALGTDDSSFDTLLDATEGRSEIVPGLTSALGWAEPVAIGARVQQLLRHESPQHRLLGVAACGVHRIDPGARLAEALDSPAALVRARALRVAGELGRRDLLPQILQLLADRNRAARFWAAWSGVRLGDRGQALAALTGMAVQPGERQLDALRLVLAVLDPEQGRAVLQQLAPSPDNARLRVIGAGLIGAPRYVPWLIEQMQGVVLARIAAESFVLITGADVNTELMETPPPEGFEDGPSDDPEDEDVVVPEDVALPWPDVPRIKDWWVKNAGQLDASPRLIMGWPIGEASCRRVLRDGFQRQRRLAALHIAAAGPGAMFNTSSRAVLQIAALDGSC